MNRARWRPSELAVRGFTRRAIERAALGTVEAQFVDDVRTVTSEFSRADRQRIISTVAEHLGERPPAAEVGELIAAVGRPRHYAATIAEAIDAVPQGAFQAWWAMSAWARGAQLALIAVVIIGGLAVHSHYAETPRLWSFCGGVVASNYEELEAAGEREYVIPYRQGARVGVYFCPFSDADGVIIQGVRATESNDRSIIQFVGSGYRVMNERVVTSFSVVDGALPIHPAGEYLLWFEFDFCSSDYASIDHVLVDYEYRGRSRTAEVPLGFQATFDMSDRQCFGWGLVFEQERRAYLDAGGPYGEVALSDGGRVDGEAVSRNLCRYLRGFPSLTENDSWEPIGDRLVYRVEIRQHALLLIRGAVEGICPEFADRYDELAELVP